jgi:hypothetical protein
MDGVSFASHAAAIAALLTGGVCQANRDLFSKLTRSATPLPSPVRYRCRFVALFLRFLPAAEPSECPASDLH